MEKKAETGNFVYGNLAQWTFGLNDNLDLVVGIAATIKGGSGKLSMKAPWQRSPQNLQDEMALAAAKEGAGNKIISNLSDPRYKGMEKWEYKVKSEQGKDSVVHYVRDPKTGELMDFKFKKSSVDTPSGRWERAPSPPAGPGKPPSWWPF